MAPSGHERYRVDCAAPGCRRSGIGEYRCHHRSGRDRASGARQSLRGPPPWPPYRLVPDRSARPAAPRPRGSCSRPHRAPLQLPRPAPNSPRSCGLAVALRSPGNGRPVRHLPPGSRRSTLRRPTGQQSRPLAGQPTPQHPLRRARRLAAVAPELAIAVAAGGGRPAARHRRSRADRSRSDGPGPQRDDGRSPTGCSRIPTSASTTWW